MSTHTRKDWKVSSCSEAGVPVVAISSHGGWGNSGDRDISRHIDAMKARARRRLAQPVVVHRMESWGDGVVHTVYFRAAQAPKAVELTCDMSTECTDPVAMIDNKGWIYCERHGLERRSWKPCRKLRPHELNRLKRGEPLKRY